MSENETEEVVNEAAVEVEASDAEHLLAVVVFDLDTEAEEEPDPTSLVTN